MEQQEVIFLEWKYNVRFPVYFPDVHQQYLLMKRLPYSFLSECGYLNEGSLSIVAKGLHHSSYAFMSMLIDDLMQWTLDNE